MAGKIYCLYPDTLQEATELISKYSESGPVALFSDAAGEKYSEPDGCVFYRRRERGLGHMKTAEAAVRAFMPRAREVIHIGSDGWSGEIENVVGSGEPTVTPAFCTRFAVVVTAHEAYDDLIPQLLEQWDKQIGSWPVVKVLAYDGPNPPDAPRGWRVYKTKVPKGGPAYMRNKALDLDVDWIQYWDTDNLPTPGHFRRILTLAYNAADNVGLFYPIVCDETGKAKVEVPKNNDTRLGYFIDTASCWRREAILSAGGWRSGIVTEDSRLAADIQGMGWKIVESRIKLLWVDHGGNRSHEPDPYREIWDTRSLGIITLLRGDYSLYKTWLADLKKLKTPSSCGLTVVSDGSATFTKRLKKALLAQTQFERITVIDAEPSRYKVKEFTNIHCRVANLYSKAIKSSPEDCLLFWEDDIRPEPDALYKLHCEVHIDDKVAAAGAAYLTRGFHDVLAAAHNPGYWNGSIKEKELPPERTMVVGMLAGGFTLWQRAALEEVPMLGPFQVRGRGVLGWDGFISKRCNDAGWKFKLTTHSKVKHFPDE